MATQLLRAVGRPSAGSGPVIAPDEGHAALEPRSRFDAEGRVLNGPALADLAPVPAEIADRAGTPVHAADIKENSRAKAQEKRQ